jgi:hypothetical protein
MFLACGECGKYYQPKKSYQFGRCRKCQKYCDFLNRKECEKAESVEANRQQIKKVYWKKGNICLWCASVFSIKTRSSRNDGKYCSRQCRFDYLAWRTEVREIQDGGDKWTISQWEFRACEECGKAFCKIAGVTQNCCSNGCSYKRTKRLLREQYEPKLTWKDCIYCGKMFCSGRTMTCSERCKRKAARGRKTGGYKERCEKHGSHYDPSVKRIAIFKRDDWTCQLCGIKCRQDGEYLEDDAPELDHIMPISKGGDHIESNVWCLCRKCNSEKADMVLV